MTVEELKAKENPYRHIVEKLSSVARANDLDMMYLPEDENPQQNAILGYLRHALRCAEDAGLVEVSNETVV